MTIKDRMIGLFENNKGVYLSGASIARELGVTRAAVWKAVKALQDAGYGITASTNRGYMLSEDADVISAAGIEKYLPADMARPDIRVFGAVTSTNLVLRELANAGAPEGTAAVAAEQTAGRGRLGRSFFSPSGTGVYISVLLRPELSAERATLITTAAAVAVCGAVEAVSGGQAGIKWVNDVFIDGKKICGILTEASLGMESGRLEHAILGVGINVYEPEGGFPPEIRETAGCVFRKRLPDARNRIAAEFLSRFMRIYRELPDGGFIEEYRRRSFVIGRRITVLSGGEATPATALDVDGECRLLVRYDDGRTAALSSGEISVRLGAEGD